MIKSSHSTALYSINSRHYYILKNEIEIEPLDLFTQLSETSIFPKVYWSHRDESESRIAFGKLLGSYKIPVLKMRKLIDGDHFEPRFYGGRSFESDPKKKNVFESFRRQYFFLPKYEIVENGGRYTLTLYHISTSPIKSPYIERPPLFFEPLSDSLDFKVIGCEHRPDYKLWEKQIGSLIADIQNKKLDKAVIARQSTLKLDRSVNPYIVLKNLQSSFSESSFFCFQFKAGVSFLGATPECLYSRQNSHLKTEAIAGTCDIHEKKNLLKSDKEINEFSYVTNFLSQSLQKMSQSLQKSKNKTVNVGYLKHLYSKFEAKLLPHINDDTIIKALFPSPALSGFPQKEALEQIKHLEDFNRHWYASPVGWISESRAELIIAIRSCLIAKENVHLFVGNGIVKDSTPKKEWEELNTKMSPFLTLFNHESI